MANPTKQFEVETVEVASDKIKIKGGGFYWSLWKTDKDGNDSPQFTQYQQMGDISGGAIEVEYYEAENKQNPKYPFKNITGIVYTEQLKEVGKIEKKQINGSIQDVIVIQVSAKLAQASFPVKEKWEEKDKKELKMRKDWWFIEIKGDINDLSKLNDN